MILNEFFLRKQLLIQKLYDGLGSHFSNVSDFHLEKPFLIENLDFEMTMSGIEF